MTILLDTNIIVDIISKRAGYLESLQVLKFCEINYAKGFVTAVTVTDVMYILRKHISPVDVRNATHDISDFKNSSIPAISPSDMLRLLHTFV